ncbi:MAG: hypothetical protein KJ754_09145 [Bacteroidetes bacterium]|nr:hypothetical protein [Bacteroidota bacterium]
MQYNDETFWKHEYNLKDHLGNTRIVFTAHSHGQPEVMQQTSYYPFGMTLQQQNFGGAFNQRNKLLYNGKELQDDELGRLSNLVYPGGYTITHHYNTNGYQNKITEAATGKLLWEGTAANARNQFTRQHIGQAHEQQIDYYAETGLVENMISGGLQDNHYNWDLLGNLTFRNTLHGKAESFGYDFLNRLDYVYHNGSQALDMTYDELGNITYKSDVGTYEYLTDKPYQLDNINNKPLQIGNETQDVQYNHFNKVIQITETNDNGQLVRQMNLQYGLDHQRIRQNIWTQDGFESEKIYVGGIYELETINRETTALHYIYGPSGLVAIKKQEMEGNTTSLQFVLNDHLGSIQLLTDEQGNLIEEYSYDAWGMRRDPYTFEPILSGSSQIAYGFTGHEQLDLFKLVNMNGRMYDPVIGRFMSPDPVLQFPNFTQGLNPYSYVLNNPLRYTDPSGYSLVGQLAALAASIAFSGGNPFAAAAIYASVMTVDYVIERKFKINIGQIFEYYTQTFVVTTLQAGGSLVIGGVIGKVGKLGRELMRATAHGAFNGTMRMAQGGKFEHGFLSGFVSSLGGSAMQSYGGNMTFTEKTAIAAVIGGTAEALGGGKFANGAVTGAFVMAFNHLMDEGEGVSLQKESEKQKLSLKDNDIVAKLIDEMKIINEKGFKGGNVSDLFDEETMSFGKNETWKRVEVEYDNSIVTITLMNPKYAPYGAYYQVKYRDFQTFGRATYGTLHIAAQYSAISIQITNSSTFYKTYYEIFGNQ